MADLTDLQAAQTVKIAGANPSTGQEDNFVEVDANGNIFTIVNNASGASAVNIQDGGNSITVDGTITAVGNVASGATDSGNPLKIGGVYNSTAPTFTTGQRGDLQLSSDGKLKVDFTSSGGQFVPTITNKFRVRYSTTPATVTSAYTTLYSRSGTGLFFGFQTDFNSANVFLRVTIDSGQIFEVTVSDLKLFQFNDTSATRMQAGSFWSTIGNTVDFSLKFPIPYSSTVLIEMKRSDATNHTMSQYMVFLTEDT